VCSISAPPTTLAAACSTDRIQSQEAANLTIPLSSSITAPGKCTIEIEEEDSS